MRYLAGLMYDVGRVCNKYASRAAAMLAYLFVMALGMRKVGHGIVADVSDCMYDV